ncbi:MAG: macro domain-containing protein [Acidobacteriota bacterium]|nr:macro domain-containing protein [Acidobacteriota bacterium]
MNQVVVRIGNIFDSRVQTLVNTVNCVGVMGKGIALEFRKRFSDMFQDYVLRCSKGEVQLGRPYLYTRLVSPRILNFPTKYHWRDVSRVSNITAGLAYLESHYRQWGITSMAMPPLGCGNGELDWNVVGPTLYDYLARLDIPVELYAPFGTPVDKLEPRFLKGRGTTIPIHPNRAAEIRVQPGAVALAAILSRIHREPYHSRIGRVTFQKIAYFATEAGIPTGLKYRRGSFGPFSEDVKRLTARLINNDLVRETSSGKMYLIQPGETYRTARDVYREQLIEWRSKIERVADLFLRLPNTTMAEVSATAHYAAGDLERKLDRKVTELDVVDAVMEWKRRRRPPLDRTLVAHATRYLNALGWVSLEPSKGIETGELATA